MGGCAVRHMRKGRSEERMPSSPPFLNCSFTSCFSSPFPPPQLLPNFRIRTIPVLGTTPAVFGQAAAAYI